MEPIKLDIKRFSPEQAPRWDNFIRQHAYNGSFVQTRKFLDYHPPERFADHSLIITKAENWLAVIPACELNDAGQKTLSSHKGSSFGGIIVNKEYFNAAYLQAIIGTLDKYLKEKSFSKVVLKQLPGIFSVGSVDSLDYLLTINGYKAEPDLTFVVDVTHLKLRRNIQQQVNQGLNYGLTVAEFTDAESVKKFHALLTANLDKHHAKPVHTPAEFLDLKTRFPAEITFYGCYQDNIMIGAAMAWQYNKKVLHLQNIAIDYDYQNLRPGDVMNYRLLESAIDKGAFYFSFGSSTEDSGRRLNFGLAYFKEGFGAHGYLKYTFSKEL